jgi:hypothetical protein
MIFDSGIPYLSPRLQGADEPMPPVNALEVMLSQFQRLAD